MERHQATDKKKFLFKSKNKSRSLINTQDVKWNHMLNIMRGCLWKCVS